MAVICRCRLGHHEVDCSTGRRLSVLKVADESQAKARQVTLTPRKELIDEGIAELPIEHVL